MSNLTRQISGLSAEEKFELLDALWLDIESNASTLSAEQSAELDRRLALYARDPSAVITWEQVKANLLKQ